ncbi:MAG TPA: LysR family transcriptional regulator [Gaiellaceae bacterium]
MAGEWWSGVELRHLVALEAVAREGSFRRAAARLGYVQSAISHQIAALEGLTGRRLIERSRGTRPLALTPAGEIMLAHAEAVIARVRAAQADLAELEGTGLNAIRVGAAPDLHARFVPAVLQVFAAPAVLNEIADPLTLVAALARGDLDLALTDMPLPRGPFDALPLCADRYVVLLREGAPLTRRRRRISCAELARLPLIAHAPTREHVESELVAAGIRPPFVLQAETGAAVHGLVAAGLGAAVLPELATDGRRAGTVTLELAEGVVEPRTVAIVWSRAQPLRADAAAFVEAARSACAAERLHEPALAG